MSSSKDASGYLYSRAVNVVAVVALVSNYKAAIIVVVVLGIVVVVVVGVIILAAVSRNVINVLLTIIITN